MSTVAISTPFNISLDFEIAEFHKRLFAYFIDTALLVIYAIGMRYILYEGIGLNVYDSLGIDIFCVDIPYIFYHLLMEVFNNGQSLGKKVIGLRVMSLEGGEPHLGQYLMRWIFRVWEWLPMLTLFVAMSESYSKKNIILYQLIITGLCGLLVVLVIAISKQSQRFGDMAAGTTVINTHIKIGIQDTVFQDVNATGYKVQFPDVMRLSDRDINAIKSVVSQLHKTNKFETASRVAYKVKEVLKIDTMLDTTEFLEKLLEDYNYLATRE